MERILQDAIDRILEYNDDTLLIDNIHVIREYLDNYSGVVFLDDLIILIDEDMYRFFRGENCAGLMFDTYQIRITYNNIVSIYGWYQYRFILEERLEMRLSSSETRVLLYHHLYCCKSVCSHQGQCFPNKMHSYTPLVERYEDGVKMTVHNMSQMTKVSDIYNKNNRYGIVNAIALHWLNYHIDLLIQK